MEHSITRITSFITAMRMRPVKLLKDYCENEIKVSDLLGVVGLLSFMSNNFAMTTFLLTLVRQ